MTLQQLIYVVTVADETSMNRAAQRLYLAQSSLSAGIHSLEEELGFSLFRRSNRGVAPTPEGEEFLAYARQIVSQYRLTEERFILKRQVKKQFSVSTQHYTFAVKAFVELVKKIGMDEYECAVHETKTYDVISDVKSFKSEIGILYLDDFNRKVLLKIFKENSLEFTELFPCKTYVYLWRGNPLANKEKITFEDLEEYPCLSFDQGSHNAFYFAEEVLSTYDYKRIIKANDRATLLNLMVGLNAYTLCSGIVCEELNGDEYCAIPLDSEEEMMIGYISRKGVPLSRLGKMYLEEIEAYRGKS